MSPLYTNLNIDQLLYDDRVPLQTIIPVVNGIINISIDNNSAHAYFKNKGRFVTQNEGKKTLLNYEWMESAYMVKENGKLKIKFYFSDSVKETSEDLN